MRRIACVCLHAFPLQVLMRRRPEWRDVPAVVVAEDKPSAEVLWVNTLARQRQIVPGMRYAAALSLARSLHAGTVSELEIQQTIAQTQEHLRAHTPLVEAATDQPGIYWLDASGLRGIVRDLATWGWNVRNTLEERGLFGSVVIGFSRFSVYAVARSVRGALAFSDPEEEERAMDEVDIGLLSVPPRVRDALYQLEIRTIADIRALPTSALRKRFGPELAELRRLADGEHDRPISPQAPVVVLESQRAWDHPLHNREHLFAAAYDMLGPLLADHETRHLLVKTLHIELRFERPPPPHIEPNPQYFRPNRASRTHGNASDLLGSALSVAPADPTTDIQTLSALLRLRLNAVELPAGTVALRLWTDAVPGAQNQLHLLRENPKRDIHAANRALALLKAELGERTVVFAELRDAHLPEAKYAWVPVSQIRLPTPARVIPCMSFGPFVAARCVASP